MIKANQKNVLFLCTGNSARSILAEALINQRSGGRFVGYSAGSHPAGLVNAGALRLLERKGISLSGLRSKSWQEFSAPGSPVMDFIFTVCDNAANESCPYWPGHPASAHWGINDPAAVKGTEAEIDAAFEAAFARLETRIDAFLALPFAALDEVALKRELDRIGSR